MSRAVWYTVLPKKLTAPLEKSPLSNPVVRTKELGEVLGENKVGGFLHAVVLCRLCGRIAAEPS